MRRPWATAQFALLTSGPVSADDSVNKVCGCSGVTIIFGPPANIRYGLTILIHNSGHVGPPLPFWAPGPPALPGLPMSRYTTVWVVSIFLNDRSLSDSHYEDMKSGAKCRKWSGLSIKTWVYLHM